LQAFNKPCDLISEISHNVLYVTAYWRPQKYDGSDLSFQLIHLRTPIGCSDFYNGSF